MADLDALLAITILCLMFAAFILERYPPDVTGVAGAAAFIILGYVSGDEALAVFSNAAPITIAAMFILSGALVRTGLLDAIANAVISHVEKRPIVAISTFVGATITASAFVNNTPVVIVLIPVVIRLAHNLGLAPTRLLIPLSYAAVMGGACTLIGTSTNLIVDGVARELGMAPFGIFEIAPVGLVCAGVGMVMLLILGPLLLPDRQTAGDAFNMVETEFLTEATILENSPLIGKPLADAAPFAPSGVTVKGIKTGQTIERDDLGERVLQQGDTIILVATTSEVLTLREIDTLRLGVRPPLNGRGKAEHIVAEAMVAPARNTRRGRIANLSFGQRYGMRVIGASRPGHVPGEELAAVLLRPADKLLLEGPPEGFDALANSGDLVAISVPSGRAYRRGKAPLALLALAAVVGLAALNLASIGVLALIAVAAILLLRCLDSDEAWASIDASILILIFAMLIVGTGLQNTGAVELFVNAVTPVTASLPPVFVLILIYFLTSLLTEIVTNNAVAVILTPIAVGIAAQAGIDPRACVVAVMMAASASFATPIGYQTNTLVYGAGNYRFADFLKIGVPMNIVVGAAAIAMITIVFPLTPQ